MDHACARLDLRYEPPASQATAPGLRGVLSRSAVAWRAAALLLVSYGSLSAQEAVPPAAAEAGNDSPEASPPGAAVLGAEQWRRVDRAVDRGLAWLASQQQADGSFATIAQGQPGVTSLCLLSFASHGHGPAGGEFGRPLQRAIDFVVSCQKPSGLIALIGPEDRFLNRRVNHTVGSCAAYNHAIGALGLSEVYGSTHAGGDERIRDAIERAIGVTLQMQRWPKDREADRGGWRYLNDFDTDDSDVSITGWHLMFLRSAKNAGFEIPDEAIEEAVAYIRRAYRPGSKTFGYSFSAPYRNYNSRGVTGAGVLALAHAGTHKTAEADAAGGWLLKNGFAQYNRRPDPLERYHYGLLTCTQAMYQLGGRYWSGFYPPTVEAILANQRPNGSWPRESHNRDAVYGEAYTTAICLMTLGAPNDLLPIFQR